MKLSVFILIILCSLCHDLIGYERVKCLIECRSTSPFSFWIYYSEESTNQFGNDHVGTFINSSDQFDSYELILPPKDILGLKLVFYSVNKAKLEIKSITFKNDSSLIEFTPEDVISEFLWQNIDSLYLLESRANLLIKKDNAGYAAPLGIMKLNSLRRYYQVFRNTDYLENKVNVSLKTENAFNLKIWYKEDTDFSFFRSVNKLIDKQDSLKEYQFTILTSGPIKGLKIDLGERENNIIIDQLGYSGGTESRSWNGRSLNREFHKTSSILTKVEDNALNILIPPEKEKRDNSLIYDHEIKSRIKEILFFLKWAIIFFASGFILYHMNKHLLRQIYLTVDN